MRFPHPKAGFRIEKAKHRERISVNSVITIPVVSPLPGAFQVTALQLIACLGLLGMSAFTAELRMKEIGIRKMLGASGGNIVTLLTGDFVKWVGVALVIAIPFAYYTMREWLQTFQYKVEIQAKYFAAAGAIVLLLVLFITSWKSIQAALRKPVDVLKES